MAFGSGADEPGGAKSAPKAAPAPVIPGAGDLVPASRILYQPGAFVDRGVFCHEVCRGQGGKQCAMPYVDRYSLRSLLYQRIGSRQTAAEEATSTTTTTTLAPEEQHQIRFKS